MRKIEQQFHAERYVAAGAGGHAFEPDGDAATIRGANPGRAGARTGAGAGSNAGTGSGR